MHSVLKKLFAVTILVVSIFDVKATTIPESPVEIKTSSRVRPISTEEEIRTRETACFCIVRHGETTMNSARRIQGNSQEGCLILTQEFLEICRIYSQDRIFDAMYSGDNVRTNLTMRCLTGNLGDETCKKYPEFNEQGLGIFEGQAAESVLSDEEFKKMLENPDYKVPEDVEAKKSSETGSEVIERMLAGIYKIAHEHIGQKIAVCSSQCAINWFYRWASKNYDAVLRLDNLDAIVFKYHFSSDESDDTIELVTKENIPFLEAYELVKKMKLSSDND